MSASVLTQLEQDSVVVSLEEIAERPFLEKVIATAELLGISRGHATFAIAFLLGSGLSLFGHYWLQKP